ncbi:Isochorismatase hydrolase [Cystobasidium minutum MCA 4210]|uniref:Isochorismatase hydrolase n=1 Tax=Cystobasidium minutum MCA 4210 TaxID=1397322 RepID=UPI0034CF9EBE|eukprot:jgi/Rhomi1/186952/estExt_fgenesh1_pg.C_1_t10201
MTDSRSYAKTALLIVDVQNDFLPPDGKLEVENGRDILPNIQALLDEERNWPWAKVVASQDFHPPGHVSFVTSHPGCQDKVFKPIRVRTPQGEDIDQILWPEHCIQGTSGCELEASIQKALQTWDAKGKYHLVQKGTHKDMDAYSAFASPTSPSITQSYRSNPALDTTSASPLASYLKANQIMRLAIVGIATDVCVKATAEDALTCGFEIVLVKQAMKGVNAENSEKALQDLGSRKGVQIVESLGELEEILLPAQR